jgi:hypothetical protein
VILRSISSRIDHLTEPEQKQALPRFPTAL